MPLPAPGGPRIVTVRRSRRGGVVAAEELRVGGQSEAWARLLTGGVGRGPRGVDTPSPAEVLEPEEHRSPRVEAKRPPSVHPGPTANAASAGEGQNASRASDRGRLVTAPIEGHEIVVDLEQGLALADRELFVGLDRGASAGVVVRVGRGCPPARRARWPTCPASARSRPRPARTARGDRARSARGTDSRCPPSRRSGASRAR